MRAVPCSADGRDPHSPISAHRAVVALGLHTFSKSVADVFATTAGKRAVADDGQGEADGERCLPG